MLLDTQVAAAELAPPTDPACEHQSSARPHSRVLVSDSRLDDDSPLGAGTKHAHGQQLVVCAANRELAVRAITKREDGAACKAKSGVRGEVGGQDGRAR